MNAKLCKALRSMAHGLSVGKPRGQLMITKKTGVITQHPQTFRGHYRALKRACKRGNTELIKQALILQRYQRAIRREPRFGGVSDSAADRIFEAATRSES